VEKKKGNFIGGVKMKKKILFVIFSLCLVGSAFGAEVINIDLNGYGNSTPYVGKAAYDDGINKWNAYYEGWGIPMGSPRSFALVKSSEPNIPSVYAAQVWIGDPGGHSYKSGSGTGLMDDGFTKTTGATTDPNIRLFGSANGATYGGTYNIYVYGNAAGSFTLKTAGGTVLGTASVTGGVAAGQFVLGGNYVVFSGITIGSGGNYVILTYSNELNALQLVSTKQPVAVTGKFKIVAGKFDVAGEINSYSTDDFKPRGNNVFGPDMFNINTDPCVGYLDSREFMKYDIMVDQANEGQYAIVLDINPSGHGDATFDIYVDDVNVGRTWRGSTAGLGPTDPPVDVNLFAGLHTVKWVQSPTTYSGEGYNGTGSTIYDVNFTRISSTVVMPDCTSVNYYGFSLAGDINKDCYVNTKDLDILTEQWLDCDDPQGCQ
jgi:hypothetical protein